MIFIQLVIVGVGKIVYDQYVLVIVGNVDFKLVVIVSCNYSIEGVMVYKSMVEMFVLGMVIEVIFLCMLLQYCYEVVCEVLSVGKYVFLEKLLGVMFFEVELLKNLVVDKGVILFVSWYLCYVLVVQVVKCYLQEYVLCKVKVIWCEDVCYWYLDQEWIWQLGGLGVFDLGINVLLIVIEILLQVMFLKQVMLEVFVNCQMLIVVCLGFIDVLGMDV